jgi:hypothetical protein
MKSLFTICTHTIAFNSFDFPQSSLIYLLPDYIVKKIDRYRKKTLKEFYRNQSEPELYPIYYYLTKYKDADEYQIKKWNPKVYQLKREPLWAVYILEDDIPCKIYTGIDKHECERYAKNKRLEKYTIYYDYTDKIY